MIGWTKALATLMASLPEILKLIKEIQAQIEAAGVDRKAKDDIAAISKAFKEKDAKALHDIFNS